MKIAMRLKKDGVAKARKRVGNRICRILIFKSNEKRNKKEENLLKNRKCNKKGVRNKIYEFILIELKISYPFRGTLN